MYPAFQTVNSYIIFQILEKLAERLPSFAIVSVHLLIVSERVDNRLQGCSHYQLVIQYATSRTGTENLLLAVMISTRYIEFTISSQPLAS